MVLKWVKQNIIGDFAAERRRREAEQPAKENEQRVELNIATLTRGDDYVVPIAGESHYMAALKRAKGLAEDEDGKSVVTIVLQREPDNQFDKNAIKVFAVIGGQLEAVGYLSRDTAVEYRDAVEMWEAKGYYVSCKGALFGGTKQKPNIGVWLDLPNPEDVEEEYGEQFS